MNFRDVSRWLCIALVGIGAGYSANPANAPPAKIMAKGDFKLEYWLQTGDDDKDHDTSVGIELRCAGALVAADYSGHWAAFN